MSRNDQAVAVAVSGWYYLLWGAHGFTVAPVAEVHQQNDCAVKAGAAATGNTPIGIFPSMMAAMEARSMYRRIQKEKRAERADAEGERNVV